MRKYRIGQKFTRGWYTATIVDYGMSTDTYLIRWEDNKLTDVSPFYNEWSEDGISRKMGFVDIEPEIKTHLPEDLFNV